jgi:hypothetical protein
MMKSAITPKTQSGLLWPSRFVVIAVGRRRPSVLATGDSRVLQSQSRFVGVFEIGIGIDAGFKGKDWKWKAGKSLRRDVVRNVSDGGGWNAVCCYGVCGVPPGIFMIRFMQRRDELRLYESSSFSSFQSFQIQWK